MRILRKYRFILLPLGAGLIVVLTTSLFALPRFKMIIDLKNELSQGKEKLSKLTEKAALLEGFDSYELERKVEVVERALPSKKAVAEILATLVSISDETGVFFVDFEISPGEIDSEKFEELSFKATFEGSNDEMKEFLDEVNKVLPVMKVISFQLREEKTTLEIRSYFSPLPKSLGKVDTPLPQISSQEEQVYREVSQFESFEGVLPAIPVGKENLFSEF